MNNIKVIFFDFEELYIIFDEINDFLNFDILNISNKSLLIKELDELDDFIIITKNQISNLNNQLIFEKFPSKLSKILEKINIEILKMNFSKKSKINVGQYLVNVNSREILKGNKKLRLTEKEVKIILFLNNSTKPTTISELQSKIWGYTSELETHTVETHIHRLRKKLLDIFNDKNFILSKKNGYEICQ